MHARMAVVLGCVFLFGCGSEESAMNSAELAELATSYAAAWSSQDPEKLASFYTGDGSLRVNAGEPSLGREAIASTARGFMEAFPDMVVTVDSVRRVDDKVEFHWIWTGTNTGPGGTGNAVRMTGYEEWTLSVDGLIVKSEGHYDEDEYQRQLDSGEESE